MYPGTKPGHFGRTQVYTRVHLYNVRKKLSTLNPNISILVRSRKRGLVQVSTGIYSAFMLSLAEGFTSDMAGGGIGASGPQRYTSITTIDSVFFVDASLEKGGGSVAF